MTDYLGKQYALSFVCIMYAICK